MLVLDRPRASAAGDNSITLEGSMGDPRNQTTAQGTQGTGRKREPNTPARGRGPTGSDTKRTGEDPTSLSTQGPHNTLGRPNRPHPGTTPRKTYAQETPSSGSPTETPRVWPATDAGGRGKGYFPRGDARGSDTA